MLECNYLFTPLLEGQDANAVPNVDKDFFARTAQQSALVKTSATGDFIRYGIVPLRRCIAMHCDLLQLHAAFITLVSSDVYPN